MAVKKLSQRKRIILMALWNLGGTATTRQIAEKTRFNVNGVAQTIGSIKGIIRLGGTGGETKWKFVEQQLSMNENQQNNSTPKLL